jgi:hypothetical protein
MSSFFLALDSQFEIAGGSGLDLAGITKIAACACPELVEGSGVGNAHPCKKRKHGASGVGMTHTTIIKGGPPVNSGVEACTLTGDKSPGGGDCKCSK